MILFLCLCSLVLVTYATWRVCAKGGSVRLNGFFFFSLGFSYYWLLPHTLGYLMQSAVPEELEIVFEQFFTIPDAAGLLFILAALIFYILFWMGYSKGQRRQRRVVQLRTRNSASAVRFWSVAAGCGVVLAIAAAIPIREYFFIGYDPSLFENYQDGVVQDALPRGTFIASTSILFALSFMRAIVKNGHLGNLRLLLLDPFMLAYYLFAVLALSMGGRLYFVTNVVTVILFLTMWFHLRVRLRGLLVLGVVCAGGASLWGVLRAGGEFSVLNMLLNVAQEPLLTSISAFSFLNSGKVPIINFPVFLASDFINLLPSSIFPWKIDFLLDPREHGYNYSMPLGGLHVFVSLMVNFGLIGTAGAFYAIGRLLGKYEHVRYAQAAVVYCLVAAGLTFTFNRDPFSVSVVKNIFENAFLIPIVLYSIQKGFFK